MGLQKYFLKNVLEAGTDEAGRGCLSGPVVAAAVILPEDFEHPLLNDSKQLTEKQRELLRPFIEKNALAFGVSYINELKIDEINILQASILAMHTAIEKLSVAPEHIIVDGNKFNSFKNIPYKTIIKGDAKFMSIAAASVLAKTYRDEFMHKIDLEFPEYYWKKNKGYPTKQHREAIREFGITPYHRKTFRLVPEQLKLEL
ncbi:MULTISPECIES: ribonuclease HII [Flavobacteriaceae]|uniref:Ribonuclease HII n=2 Tax=Flavobacteriaceae TaxID=49546 RepID=A0A4Y8AQ36_9FLAO|nr:MULTISPECIES: ribonuclease HII [Flavobacteriaceae]TEW72908.1 ribonuclease HII [Gramella jeungdoensis]GGK48661.1 ribonuclease HII [Lutibacter litoralis]